MKEQSFIIVPVWLYHVLEQKCRGDLSILLDLNSLSSILSETDVQTYLAMQDIKSWQSGGLETECAGTHLGRLLDGLRNYQYGEEAADKIAPGSITAYLKRYSNGYVRACMGGTASISAEGVEKASLCQPVPMAEFKPVNADVFAVVVGILPCEAEVNDVGSMSERVQQNYLGLINYMRSCADLKTVSGFAFYSNHIASRLITHRLGRI